MSRIVLLCALALAVIIVSGGDARAEARPVVVELFTSEGCSSCPPADDALAELARSGAAAGRPIIALAWHVDYWDRLGWPDPFARHAYTQRQTAYARALGARGLYTPQAVVDGRTDVVGSRKGRLVQAIEAARARAPAATVTAKVARAGRRFTVTPAVVGAPEGARVLVALTESGLSVKVPRGENAGRTLQHDHVVRAFVEGAPGAALAFEAPAGVRLARSRVVVLVQAPDRSIVAATSVRPAG